MAGVDSRFKNHLDGYSLHDLDIVTCCILRWEEGENSPGACLDTLHLSIKYLTRVGIHYYFHLLSWFHSLQLGFLIIGGDPNIIERNYGHKGLSRLNLITNLHRLLCNVAV